MVITLRYRRLHEAVDGDFPYEGSITADDCKMQFTALPFKKLVGMLHEVLQKYQEDTRVIFQRVDRPGITPFELGPHTIKQLRVDPVGAYRSMNFNSEPSLSATGMSVGRDFSRHIYVAVSNCRVEDPITGTWKVLAYGHKQGWKIRGDNNKSSTWISIVGLLDDAPEGSTSIERIVFVRWAIVDVEDLLNTSAKRFYIPRPWNTNGPWISRDELQYMYDNSKEKAS